MLPIVVLACYLACAAWLASGVYRAESHAAHGRRVTGLTLGALGLVLHAVLLWRGVFAKAAPAFTLAETASLIGWPLASIAIALSWRRPRLAGIGSVLIALAGVAAGATFEAAGGYAVERSSWEVGAHIVLSTLAYALLTIAVALAIALLSFALTRKHFQTPWGLVETDQEFMTAMDRQFSEDYYQDEFVHKGEHSIELQLVFLKALWPGTSPFRIAPILCGSFHEAILQDQSPMELPGVASLIQALKKAMAETERKVCVLASADLAHVGPRFGDPVPPDRFSLLNLAEEDRRLLGYAERIDGEGFFRILAREKDRRKVCGLSPIYVLLNVLDGAQGKLLKYNQSLDPTTQSVVTFGSVAYYS